MAENSTGVAAIVARIPRADASEVIAAGFRSQIDSFERLSGASQADILTGVQRNLERWWRWLSTGMEPSDDDFDPLREWARARATEGVRLEDLLGSLHLGAQLGWKLMRRYARRDETDALIAAAGLLM